MKGLLKKSIAAFALVSGVTLAQAETVYITDVLYVPVRSGPGNEYRIIHRGMPSGTAMTVVEQGETFTKVRLENGQEGFIRSQYLQNTPVARNEIKNVKTQLTRLQQENSSLKSDKSELNKKLGSLEKSWSTATSEQESLASELRRIKEISASSLAIDERNKVLVEENLKLKNQLQVVEGEAQKMAGDHKVAWFLSGAGAILGGVVLGLVLPNMRPRKKRSDWV
ncbi:TIGR04211 family SH3 domain-containing protein [Spongorhabdus nitratireducens]